MKIPPRKRKLVFLLPILYLGLFLHAETKDPLADFPSRVKSLTLPNGLRVLMVERPAAPTLSFAMYLRTGGLDDDGGKSGLAHMFEHMLFKGTKTIGTKNYAREAKVLEKIDEAQEALLKSTNADQTAALQKKIKELEAEHAKYLVEEEFWKIYERAGGTELNASTGYDFTNYTISLPARYLELWAAMEADRIKHPVLREFYKERDVVLEERRMRVENSPQGKLWEAFLAAAFQAHPYGRPIIGWESDISRVTRRDADTFFKSHYGINRLVIGIVGGAKSEDVFALIKKYFGSIPAPEVYADANVSIEPEQEGERRVQVLYDAEPSLVMGFHRPNMQHADEAALSVLAEVLDLGRTGRLYKNVIEKKKIGLSAWAGGSFPGERDPNLFVLGGAPRPPHTTADLERAIGEEIENIKKNGVTDEELRRIKNNLESSLLRGLASNLGLARELAYYESVGGDWKYLFRAIENIRRVTSDDVARVARLYLTDANRTVGTIVRKK